MIISVGISNRHIHITKETFKKLFDSDNLPSRNYLKITGEYASSLTLNIKWNNQIIENVRIVGPFRNYNQIELSQDECNILNINPPIRKSGDLEGSNPIILIGPKGEVKLDKGTIKAEKHIHIDSVNAKNNNLIDNQIVPIYQNNTYLFDAKIKIGDCLEPELHIDTYEAKKYNLTKESKVELHVENR